MPFEPEWLTRKHPKAEGIKTHLVVVCDSFDYEDYPVYVDATEDVHAVVAKYNGPNMQRVMEVYDLTESTMPLEEQRKLGRSFTYGEPVLVKKWVMEKMYPAPKKTKKKARK